MAGEFTELYNKGYDLGTKLANGETKEARAGYDALITRIHDESKNDTVQEQARLDKLHQGMAKADPSDVKSPGNGTAFGYYIYWNTEDVVTEAIQRVTDYCKAHSLCQGVGFDASRLPAAIQDAGVLRNMSPAGDAELNSMLQETNMWLYKKIPDGLERWVFNDDFNRRRHEPAIQVRMEDHNLELFKKRLDY
ncbi:MAG TPA: hypothetical protein V6C86_05480 [Oculatellaceae cyanobacterium]